MKNSIGAVAGARYFGGYLIEFIKKKTIVTADFDSRDESYRYIASKHEFTITNLIKIKKKLDFELA